jgi:hypothetical protein
MPIATAKTRPRFRMAYLRNEGGLSVGSLCRMTEILVFRDPKCCRFAKVRRRRASHDPNFQFFAPAPMASERKCLAANNKSRNTRKATKKRPTQLSLKPMLSRSRPSMRAAASDESSAFERSPVHEGVNRQGAKMKKLLAVAAVLAAVTTANAAELGPSDIQRAIETYRSNEIRFERDFSGRSIEFVWTFNRASSRRIGEGYRVSFGNGSFMGGVDCVVTEQAVLDEIVEWNKGQRVNVSGIIKTVSVGTLQLKDCTITAKK